MAIKAVIFDCFGVLYGGSIDTLLTKEEVPSVAARINALQSSAPPIPKGIDPTKVRPNRRAMRGR